MQEDDDDTGAQRKPELTIRGAAEARKEAESMPMNPEDLPNGREQPQASTSAVTLDNGHEEASKASVLELRSRPKKPWGLAEYGIRPPPADLLPDPAVEAKLRHFHALRAQGVFFNDSLQSNKSFRNPSILSKLVDFVNVDEKLSAIPSDVWSSSRGVSPQAWATSIAERQKQESEERERAQQRGKRTAIDFASSSTSSSRARERIRLPDPVSSSSGSKARYGEDRKPSRWDSADSSRHPENRRRSDREKESQGNGRQESRSQHRTRSRSPTSRRY